jgi:hypothetical protein
MKFFLRLILVDPDDAFQNPPSEIDQPLSVSRNSAWRPRWPPFKQTSRTPLLFYIERWFWCQAKCIGDKEFIEIVYHIVEGLIDKKILDGRRFKGKKQNSIMIHTRAMVLASNPMFSESSNSLK